MFLKCKKIKKSLHQASLRQNSTHCKQNTTLNTAVHCSTLTLLDLQSGIGHRELFDFCSCLTSGVTCRPDIETNADVGKNQNMIWSVRAESWETCGQCQVDIVSGIIKNISANFCRDVAKCRYWTFNPALYYPNCMLLKSCCKNDRIYQGIVSGNHKCYP